MSLKAANESYQALSTRALRSTLVAHIKKYTYICVRMVSDKHLSRRMISLCKKLSARLDECERMEISERKNEDRLSEVVNGDVSQKSEHAGESWRASGVYKCSSMPREVAKGCTDFSKSGTSCLSTSLDVFVSKESADSSQEEVSTGGSLFFKVVWSVCMLFSFLLSLTSDGTVLVGYASILTIKGGGM